MKYTKEQLQRAVQRDGHMWRTGKYRFDLNVVAVHNPTQWHDWMTITFKEDGEWKMYQWPVTLYPVLQFKDTRHQNKYNAILEYAEKVYNEPFGYVTVNGNQIQ